jgi:hypothetical protein
MTGTQKNKSLNTASFQMLMVTANYFSLGSQDILLLGATTVIFTSVIYHCQPFLPLHLHLSAQLSFCILLHVNFFPCPCVLTSHGWKAMPWGTGSQRVPPPRSESPDSFGHFWVTCYHQYLCAVLNLTTVTWVGPLGSGLSSPTEVPKHCSPG